MAEITAQNAQAYAFAQSGALAFSEEFNGPISFWDQRDAPGGRWASSFGYQGENGYGSYTLPGNGEEQIYTSPYFRNHKGDFAESPFVVNNDGTVSIWAKPSNNSELFGYHYTSGLLTTKPSFAQTYGYFEIRADVPSAAGTWPAFWLLSADGSWPPELDVMEILGDKPGVVYTSVHTAETGSHTSEGGSTVTAADGMHTYGLLWGPEELVWYVDGAEAYRADTPDDMHKPMYILANLAVGGYWPGQVDVSALPAEYRIDYIRAYAYPVGSTPAAPQPEPEVSNPEPTPAPVPEVVEPAPQPSPAPPPVSESDGPAGAVEINSDVFVAWSGVTDIVLTGARQTVTGNAANNVITSNDTVNVIDGGAGDDVIYAGRSSDTLTGGEGADTFTFREAPWNSTHITDFQSGVDKIDVSGLLSGYSGADPIADGYIGIDDDGAGHARVWVDADGRGGDWASHIATFDNLEPLQLQWSDFKLDYA